MAATIILNGKPVSPDARATTVGALIAAQGIDPSHVVVEVNREIVRRDDFDRCPVRDGDVIEVLRFVGGG
ncbi:MAG: sulfur carrier protein ThiS [Chitinispirillaceae bacterium]|nr:sulfur carrier protein ThiS [Chitinispirillaceae bacterium]